MKRKSYFSFLIGKLIAGLLIGTIIFGVSFYLMDEVNDSALWRGYYSREETYKKVIANVERKGFNDLFYDVLTNFYSADYLRIAKVNEDGSLENVFETNYDVIPVEENMHHWYYVTNDKELLAKGKKTCQINGVEWVIEYKKCDELWSIGNQSESRLINNWDLCAITEGYYANPFLWIPGEISGNLQYIQPIIKTYYVEDDTLHPGKVALSTGIGGIERGKGWDFTDKSNADKYSANNNDGKDIIIRGNTVELEVNYLTVFSRKIRPEKFLNDNKNVFNAQNISALRNKDTEPGYPDVYNNYMHAYEENCEITGYANVVEVEGQRYLIAYAMRTVSFGTFAKPFLLIYVAVILVFCLAISCLSAIKPYRQYKKAYENNMFKNDLIDSLAHNLKTPLQILGGYAENLKDVKGDSEKDRYADQILEKTREMNNDIETILKSAEKTDRKFVKCSVHECFDEVATKLGADLYIKGDTTIAMDKDYFKTALFCLIDNANKYKKADSKIEVQITSKLITICNRTDSDKFTPGTGIAIAGRILEQHKLHLETMISEGVFEARFGKHSGKQKKK